MRRLTPFGVCCCGMPVINSSAAFWNALKVGPVLDAWLVKDATLKESKEANEKQNISSRVMAWLASELIGSYYYYWGGF